MSDEKPVKRKYVRFQPEPNTTIWISKNVEEFQEDFLGLVDGESHGGSSFTINQDIGLKDGDFVLAKVGHLDPLMAEVRWTKKFADNLFRFGLMYLE